VGWQGQGRRLQLNVVVDGNGDPVDQGIGGGSGSDEDRWISTRGRDGWSSDSVP
jgi:hypothetical protein